jgi:hypothetical protein
MVEKQRLVKIFDSQNSATLFILLEIRSSRRGTVRLSVIQRKSTLRKTFTQKVNQILVIRFIISFDWSFSDRLKLRKNRNSKQPSV